MGHKIYMLLGDVEVPYEHPPRGSMKSTFSIDFYALSDEICCQKQITGNIVKLANFSTAAMKNCWKMTNDNFRKF